MTKSAEQEAAELYPVPDVVRARNIFTYSLHAIREFQRVAYLKGHASGYAKAIEACARVAETLRPVGHDIPARPWEIVEAIRTLAAPADAGKGG